MSNDVIDEEDARAMVRLIGNVALMDATRQERRRAIMLGLADLIEADVWAWATAGHANPGEQPIYTVILKGGFTDEQFATIMHATEHPDMAKLTSQLFEDFASTCGHTTRLRQQVDPTNFFERSEVYHLWRKADIGPNILSLRPTESGQISFIGLYRRFNRPLFSERESRIAHIVLSELPTLHDDTTPTDMGSLVGGLAPRPREILNLLLQGNNRKEIAYFLDLSTHTVGDYIKEVYRRFNVHSQSELIRRFLAGDGGDLPNPMKQGG